MGCSAIGGIGPICLFKCIRVGGGSVKLIKHLSLGICDLDASHQIFFYEK
jgi:hypothetical protein